MGCIVILIGRVAHAYSLQQLVNTTKTTQENKMTWSLMMSTNRSLKVGIIHQIVKFNLMQLSIRACRRTIHSIITIFSKLLGQYELKIQEVLLFTPKINNQGPQGSILSNLTLLNSIDHLRFFSITIDHIIPCQGFPFQKEHKKAR